MLDTTFDCWSGSYPKFRMWRNWLAELAGIPLEDCGHGVQYASLDWSEYPQERFYGEWPENEPQDPLLILIVHSDCEGDIKRRHTNLLADRLQELLNLAMSRERSVADEVWCHKTMQFIKGLRKAHAKGKKVRFI